jgi:hypothetical protein
VRIGSRRHCSVCRTRIVPCWEPAVAAAHVRPNGLQDQAETTAARADVITSRGHALPCPSRHPTARSRFALPSELCDQSSVADVDVVVNAVATLTLTTRSTLAELRVYGHDAFQKLAGRLEVFRIDGTQRFQRIEDRSAFKCRRASVHIESSSISVRLSAFSALFSGTDSAARRSCSDNDAYPFGARSARMAPMTRN